MCARSDGDLPQRTSFLVTITVSMMFGRIKVSVCVFVDILTMKLVRST